MKRLLFTVMALVLAVSCAGCRGDAEPGDNTVDGTITDNDYTGNGIIGTEPDGMATEDETVERELGTGEVRNDLETRPNARDDQAGKMDYQGSYPYAASR